MVLAKPAVRPANPCFSSGPCTKPPGFSVAKLTDAALGRSHRAAIGKAKLRKVIDETRRILEIPDDYRVAIVPASDTGAFEMAMWNLLGERPVEMLAWESFGTGWVRDAVRELKVDAEVRTAPYGEIVDFTEVDWDRDICFTWNGTTSGVCVPSGEVIPEQRAGLTLCDATSAAFAMELPWSRLDATTFSWQKVLGGEAAHGMLVLSPRAVERLESHRPTWPLPKIFRLTGNGRLIDGVFRGETINTPSMLAVEDCLHCLAWARSVGGLTGLVARANVNAATVARFVDAHDWIEFLARDPAVRSTTSICLKFTDTGISDRVGFAKAVVGRMAEEAAAYDIGSYRDAPPGLRIWCGSTVEPENLETMLPWLEWAYSAEIAARKMTAL